MYNLPPASLVVGFPRGADGASCSRASCTPEALYQRRAARDEPRQGWRIKTKASMIEGHCYEHVGLRTV